MFDVVTIGSATKDAFIETDGANIVSVAKKESNRKDREDIGSTWKKTIGRIRKIIMEAIL